MSQAARDPHDLDAWLATVADAFGHAAIGIRTDGVVVSWSRAAAELSGWGRDEVVGGPVARLLPPGRERRLAWWLRRLHEGATLAHVTARVRRRSGDDADVVLTVLPVAAADGETLGAVAVVESADAERCRAERARQLQRLEALGRLATTVAHDFNNLLTAIIGFGTFALDRLPRGRTRDAVEQMVYAATRAGDLTRRLVTFGAHGELAGETARLDGVIAALAPLLRRTLGSAIELVLELRAGGAAVRASAAEVEQIVVNLVVNARDAMPDGGTLRIATSAEQAGTRRAAATISVSDTGTGIEPHVLPRVFDRFFSTKTAGENAGIGLATVHEAAVRLGGSVGCRSELGAGTTFDVRLPLAEPPA
jgi:PAS domain S-box-containing protein